MEHRVWIPVKPEVKQRVRFRSRRRGGPYTPEKTVEFEKAVRRAWSEVAPQFTGPVGVAIEYHREGLMVTIYDLEESVRPVGVLGDIDNLVKATLDGLQPHPSDVDGGAGGFSNDRQVELLEVMFVGIPRKPKAPRADQEG